MCVLGGFCIICWSCTVGLWSCFGLCVVRSSICIVSVVVVVIVGVVFSFCLLLGLVGLFVAVLGCLVGCGSCVVFPSWSAAVYCRGG